jgi:uncharacterized protein YkwD
LLAAAAGCTPEISVEGDDGGARADGAAAARDFAGTVVDLAMAPAADLAQNLTDLQYCVAQTNAYRATVGLGPLAESATLEAYAAAGAMNDGTNHMAHQHFIQGANAGNFTALAENEIPWWSLSQFGSVTAIIAQGLQQMWAEGPPPPGQDNHYANMTGPYTNYGCGVFINGDEVTVTMDFD